MAILDSENILIVYFKLLLPVYMYDMFLSKGAVILLECFQVRTCRIHTHVNPTSHAMLVFSDISINNFCVNEANYLLCHVFGLCLL